MFIDRTVNFFLGIFGIDPKSDEHRIHFHSQNLNEDKRGNPRFFAFEGRAWLRAFGRHLTRFEWALFKRWQFALSLEAGGEDGGLTWHIAVPWCSLWFNHLIPTRFKTFGFSDRVLFDICTHDWALWWQFGGDRMRWDSKTPKWKNGCFHFDDFFLGKQKYTNEKTGEPKDIMVPMPEGEYLTKMQLETSTWRRPRWPFPKVMVGYKINIPRGIPHQGKGENSWDCGEDGLFGCYSEGESIREAIAKVQTLVLKDRKRYDGNMMAKYPDPATRPPPQDPGPQEQTSAN